MRKGKGKGGITVGGKRDGARPSKKHQVTALLPQNKMGHMGRKRRMSKMEAKDGPV